MTDEIKLIDIVRRLNGEKPPKNNIQKYMLEHSMKYSPSAKMRLTEKERTLN